MLVNHKLYLTNEFYGTCAYAIAEEIESLLVTISWCDDDGKLDSLYNALDHARYMLFKTVGDACLLD